jgi:hypothetical protein
MTTQQTTEKEGRRHNSTYPKVAVQWLNQAFASMKFYSWLTANRFEIATFG